LGFKLEILGFALSLAIWWLMSIHIASKSILPNPLDVVKSAHDLYEHDDLIGHMLFSIGLNVWGYMEALLFAVPLGFLIGLFGVFESLLRRQIDALRFVPLTAMIGLFIAWFGIGSSMKAHFLAFGIFVYLLPVVVQRVKDLDHVYVQTAYTLGASKTQTILKVFLPGVFSALMDDIRVLVAISWTYIIAAEIINMTGGVGALIQASARQSRIDKVFALIFIIILIGIIQDRLFRFIDKILFPQKY
jgi:NitT/TauT family transport system permease protein